MSLVEIASLAIVAVYVAARLRAAPPSSRWAVAARLGALAAAGLVGEDSVIRAYGFYAYAPSWRLVVDRVPLLVVLVWPVVIDSAAEVARKLTAGRARIAAVAALLVLADAALIEPVSVTAGLWAWTEPGLFRVPPIGVFGWAVFALAAVWTLEGASGARSLAVVLLAPLATHVALVGSWWAAFRWVSAPIPSSAAAAGAAAASALAVGWVVLRRRALPPLAGELLRRAPGAGFFFALLTITGRAEPWLAAYVLPFGAPYVALLLAAGARRKENSGVTECGAGVRSATTAAPRK